jgi:hypothetical protein
MQRLHEVEVERAIVFMVRAMLGPAVTAERRIDEAT